MSYTFELNNERRDANFVTKPFKQGSTVVEVFSAMTNGKDIARYGVKADKVANYVKELNQKASEGDLNAISEMNELRRFSMEPVLLKEVKLLGIYGNYRQLGYNDSCEIEITEFANLPAKEQALGQDVAFPVVRKKRVSIATTTISGGYAVNYRKAALGDMSDENELQDQIRVQIRNLAALYVMHKVYDSIKNAKGVKYIIEDAGLTKVNVDKILTNIRRFGKPTVCGDYALLSQFNGFAGYAGVTPTVNGISEAVMNEIHNTGLMGMYNGAILSEIPNPYDLTTLDAKSENFATMLPTGLGYVIPAGGQSPIHMISRGGLTSFSGTDITTGQILTRYDWEFGSLVAPGREYEIGIILDKNLTTDFAAQD